MASKILIQISDRAVINERINFAGVEGPVHRGHCVTFPKEANIAVLGELVILRDFLRMDIFAQMGPIEGRKGPLVPATSVIQTRSTSWRSDGTICFGNLIKLNLQPLPEVDQQTREEYRQRGEPFGDDQFVPD